VLGLIAYEVIGRMTASGSLARINVGASLFGCAKASAGDTQSM
jgi:hypothetical protein